MIADRLLSLLLAVAAAAGLALFPCFLGIFSGQEIGEFRTTFTGSALIPEYGLCLRSLGNHERSDLCRQLLGTYGLATAALAVWLSLLVCVSVISAFFHRVYLGLPFGFLLGGILSFALLPIAISNDAAKGLVVAASASLVGAIQSFFVTRRDLRRNGTDIP